MSNTDVPEKNQRTRTTILQGNSTKETRLCWSVGKNALVILEGKITSKEHKVDRRECGLTMDNAERLCMVKLNKVLRFVLLGGP